VETCKGRQKKIKEKWQNEKNKIEREMEESMYTRMVRWKERGKGRWVERKSRKS
jgi:hypothetical protein